MEPAAQQQLAMLESAVTQFFGSATDPALKRQIEAALTDLKNQPQSYSIAQQCLIYSANPMVHFFAVQVIEEWATRRWESLPDAEKVRVRTTLLQFYTEKFTTLAPYVYNKIAKVVADIVCGLILLAAKLDWPHLWPDFMQMVAQLTTNGPSCLLGLVLLRAVLDEFVSTKDVLPTARKMDLRKLLTASANSLRDVLITVLESAQEFAKVDLTPGATVETKERTILNSVVVHSFFMWAGMDVILSAPLFTTLLRLVSLENAISIKALACLNEVMGKTFVPAQFESFLLDIFQRIFALLGNISPTSTLLSAGYMEKIIEFTQLFVTHHFARAESSGRFPIMEFLGLLYRFTFIQPSLHGFLECLQIWECLIEFLRAASTVQKERYKEGLCGGLATEVQRRIQFSLNAQQLSQLYTTKPETEQEQDFPEDEGVVARPGASELETFLAQGVEILGRITELYPHMLLALHELINQRTGHFLSELLKTDGSMPNAVATRDAETVLSLLGRLAEFSMIRFQETFASTLALLRRVTEIAVVIGSRGLVSQHPELHDISTQTFGTLRAFCPWFAQYHNAAQSNPQALDEMGALFAPLLELIGRCADNKLPEPYALSAFQLLNSLVVTVKLTRPPLFSVTSLRTLFDSLSAVCPHFSVRLHSAIYVALSNALLVLPPATTLDPTNVYSTFLESLLSPLRVVAQANQPTVAEYLGRCVAVLSAVLFAVQELGGRTAKPIVFAAMREVLPLILPFVRHSIAAATHAMDFFAVVFQVLPAQMGVANVQLVTGETLAAISPPLSQVGTLPPGSRQLDEICLLVQKFLALLRYIAESSVASFETFIPSILSLCVDRIVPFLNALPHTEIHAALLHLCASLVQQHPRTFFANDETSLKLLGSILEIFLAAMGEKVELSVLTVCMAALNNLHEKQNLFQRLLFTNQYCPRYVLALFALLFARSHDLLRDELIRTLYSIASVDFNCFYAQVLPAVLDRLSLPQQYRVPLLAHYNGATDAPSFAQAAFAMLNDIAFYSSRLRG